MAPQLDADWTQLSAFQRDLLVAISQLKRSDETCYGLAIKRVVEDVYPETVTHGRLYQNLDELDEQHLIEKRQLDRRTNEYVITDEGTALLRTHAELLQSLV
ncbi:PadR family transcriptional regulator [Halomicroarcula sp. GCM10025709]|uniref:PadR family transcriptional regulator n=1 Tax=Haloarcula TaxID=2237 RepID=UPI0024C43AFC|nr:helix-turn-helix transcriptional regulator [Halomicroarcula sp. YJ-61-S]